MVYKKEIETPILVEDQLWDGTKYVPAFIHVSGLELGPALGGCRITHYDRLSLARSNVEELSYGMRYKAALANLPFGGGKSVIVTDPKNGKTPELLENFAYMVNELGGNYITAEDVGTNTDDIKIISRHSDHVAGLESVSGDPSPATAYGVYQGLVACLEHRGIDSVDGLTISLKGAGKVAEYLVFGFPDEEKYGAYQFPGLINLNPQTIYFSEINNDRSHEFKEMARVIGLENKLKARSSKSIYQTQTDIFIPAARGHSAAAEYLPQLYKAGCKIIAGPENNQLKNPQRDISLINEAGILWAPDFAINAGGLTSATAGYIARINNKEFNYDQVMRKIEEIGPTIEEILQKAKESNNSTLDVANKLAEERISKQQALLL